MKDTWAAEPFPTALCLMVFKLLAAHTAEGCCVTRDRSLRGYDMICTFLIFGLQSPRIRGFGMMLALEVEPGSTGREFKERPRRTLAFAAL